MVCEQHKLDCAAKEDAGKDLEERAAPAMVPMEA